MGKNSGKRQGWKTVNRNSSRVARLDADVRLAGSFLICGVYAVPALVKASSASDTVGNIRNSGSVLVIWNTFMTR